MEKLLYADPAGLFGWPVAADYHLVEAATGCEIIPVGRYEGKTSPGLRDPDLFGSFARLWADGPPSEARVLRWVRRFGLLTADVDERPRADNGLPNEVLLGDPVMLSAFRDEARTAHAALIVYEALVSRRYKVIQDRITRERVSPASGPPGPYAHSYVRFADYDFDAAHFVPADGELDEETGMRVVVGGLEHLLSNRLEKRMTLRFGTDLASKRPLSAGGRPVPVWIPKDLKAALWFQFQQEIADARHWRICAGCRQPFPVRRDKQGCCSGSPNCRKQKERRRTAS